MIPRTELESHLNTLLAVDRFKDYGPNGLQVEGRARICKVVSGVTASLALIEAAVAQNADAIVVHHGLFWRGQDGRLTGWLKQRVERLMAHQINLFAFHLPLDAHPDLGNNAQLGRRLGWSVQGRFGDQDIGFLGSAREAWSDTQWAAHIGQCLERTPILIPGDGRAIRRMAWCTGGGQGYFEAAIAARADLFLTGEISEPQTHLARETGVAFVACGHHATERYGAPALGEHLAAHFGLIHEFIDIPNPA